MLEIDGSYGEGGGQLLRVAVALSAITGIPARLTAIRAGRDKPGMAPQHLAAVRAVAEVCGATTEGLERRSETLGFAPGALRAGRYRFDVGTAGSVTLVLQAILPVLASAPGASEVTVTGGTDVRGAPPLDYFIHVLLPLLRRMGLRARLHVRRRGYYPRGGGEMTLEVTGAGLRPLLLESLGTLAGVRGLAHVGNLPAHIAERMRAAATEALGGFGSQARIETQVLGPEAACGHGGAIVLWAAAAGGALGAGRVAERGVRAESLGESAAAELRGSIECGAALDVHATDQVLIYAALAGGPSRFTAPELSSHAMTAMWLIEQFTPTRFTVEPAGRCISIGARPQGGRMPAA